MVTPVDSSTNDSSRNDSGLTVTPTPRDCERCLAEVARLYGVEGDPADALPLMEPGDSEDVLVLADAAAQGRAASHQDPPSCASCGATFGRR